MQCKMQTYYTIKYIYVKYKAEWCFLQSFNQSGVLYEEKSSTLAVF